MCHRLFWQRTTQLVVLPHICTQIVFYPPPCGRPPATRLAHGLRWGSLLLVLLGLEAWLGVPFGAAIGSLNLFCSQGGRGQGVVFFPVGCKSSSPHFFWPISVFSWHLFWNFETGLEVIWPKLQWMSEAEQFSFKMINVAFLLPSGVWSVVWWFKKKDKGTNVFNTRGHSFLNFWSWLSGHWPYNACMNFF